MVLGHRGGFKPDNTIKTFKRALEAGVEAVELDVSTVYIKVTLGMAKQRRSANGSACRRQRRAERLWLP